MCVLESEIYVNRLSTCRILELLSYALSIRKLRRPWQRYKPRDSVPILTNFTAAQKITRRQSDKLLARFKHAYATDEN